MDLFDAATYFDGLQVLDAYTDEVLFVGQLEPYAGTERDSMTGWRRTCSAATVSVPERGAVAISGNAYLTGRVIPEYFRDEKIREHLLLQPADGLFIRGSAADFLAEYSPGLISFYGALALRKEQKEEAESSQFFNLYNIYMADSESAARDQIVLSPDGVYFRVQNIELQTGGMSTLYVSEMGSGVKIDVTYTSAGDYDVETGSTFAGATSVIPAFFERWQENYQYRTWATGKFQPGDVVLTISEADYVTPGQADRILVGTQYYRVLGQQSDNDGALELHIRPSTYDLVVET